MDSDDNINDQKRKLSSSSAPDGIGDIFSGISFLCLGSMIYFDSSFFLFFIPMTVPLSRILKKKVIYPGTAYLKMRAQKKKTDPRLSRLIVFVLFIGTAAAVMRMRGIDFPVLAGEYALLAAGGVCAVILFLAGLFSGTLRICAYSVVMLALFIHAQLNQHSRGRDVELIREAAGRYVLIFGAFIFISGIILLIKFLVSSPAGKDSPDSR